MEEVVTTNDVLDYGTQIRSRSFAFTILLLYAGLLLTIFTITVIAAFVTWAAIIVLEISKKITQHVSVYRNK